MKKNTENGGKIIIGKIDFVLREVNDEQKKEAGGEETRVKKNEKKKKKLEKINGKLKGREWMKSSSARENKKTFHDDGY